MNQVIFGIHRKKFCRRAQRDISFMPASGAIRVMTLSGSKPLAGKSWSLPLLLLDHKEFARKLGRKLLRSHSAPLDNHRSVSAHIHHRAGNTIIKAIVPALPFTTSCIFIDTSACLCVPQSALIPRPYHLVRSADSSRDEDTINTATPTTALPPPSRFHHNL